MRRFKIESREAGQGAPVVRGPDANHMINVLRLTVGERVVLFDGAGREYEAVIAKIASGEVRLSIVACRQSRSESTIRITVAQGFLKEKKMDRLVRPLTELGINRWIPFFAARSVSRPDARRLAHRVTRWQKIALESLKQCRRGRPPLIETVADFGQMLRHAGKTDVKLVFWEKADTALVKAACGGASRDLFVILGPEGGLTAEEVTQARQAGFQSVSLGPRILRAETATVAAATLVQYLFGDLGKEGVPVS